MTLTQIRRILLIIEVKMSSTSNGLLLPNGVRGMKNLDREKFSRNVTVPIIKVSDEKLSKITQICKSYFLKLSNFKPVQSLEERNSDRMTKCIYFNPEKVSKWLDISEADRSSLKQQNIDESNYEDKEIQLTYDNFKYDEIFKAVLPENEEIVSGFSQIGHIIHLNLRDHLLEYRSLIGQVLIDKISTCRTVVNKSSIIDNTYRNFSMEVIAGEEDFLVTVKENRCNFQFDFSKVYWNSRLCKEHERILEFLKPGDILFDVFCGVGPFAVPAAKRKCRVFANDLNPESYKWLNHNAKQNKVNMDLFKSYNVDGKDFICNTFRDFILEYCKGKENLKKEAKIHITMNLPAIAVEFLKLFNGLLEESELKDKFDYEIVVYVYCFAIGEDPYATAKQMVCENIGKDISALITDVFDVRNVSPKKEMMRVTFKLTKEILFSNNEQEQNGEPPAKRHCFSDVLPREQVMDFEDIDTVVSESQQIIRECFQKFQLDEVFLSFNGGKDCTVLLDLLINVLEDIHKSNTIRKELKIVYIRTKGPFREIEDFVTQVEEHYGVKLMVMEGEMKSTLQRILENDSRLKACFMGTRRSDPYSEGLKFMQKTDQNWPQIVRVSPLLNWSYHQIWSYILQRGVPYCSLYDRGYTSIGGVHNTSPNPALAYKSVYGGLSYQPAWKLADPGLERAGRGPAPAHNGHADTNGHADQNHIENHI